MRVVRQAELLGALRAVERRLHHGVAHHLLRIERLGRAEFSSIRRVSRS